MKHFSVAQATFETVVAAIEADGFAIVDQLLDEPTLDRVHAALEPELNRNRFGRNNFEGHRTDRIYTLVARGKVFEDITTHPLVMGVCDRLLQPNYLLTASQAIHIRPGETPQPWHTDDSFYPIPRPRAPISVGTIWAIDEFTAASGATEVVPASHGWEDDRIMDLIRQIPSSTNKDGQPLPVSAEARQLEGEACAVEMPPGSVIIFAGTLVHRGGGNTGERNRLALSNQYCQPWARPQENYTLAIDAERLREMTPRTRELCGFSIHPPFMGHAGGRHPLRQVGL